MTIPPVGVRFQPEGEDLVASAIRDLDAHLSGLVQTHGKVNAVQAESILSTRTLTGAVTGLAQAYLLVKTAEFVNDSLEAVEAQGKLAKATGASAEGISVLTLAAKKANVEQDQLAAGLRLFAKNLTGLRDGEAAATAGFKAFGLTAKDFIGLSTDQAVLKVAEAQARYADSAAKSAAAGALFGTRAGAQLLPLLAELADGGFARVRDEAAKLGLLLNDQAVADAQKYNDALVQLKATAQGLALQLGEQLATPIAGAANLLGDRGSESLSTVQLLGKGLGVVVRLVAAILTEGVDIIRSIGNYLGIAAATVTGVVDGIIHRDPGEILRSLRTGIEGAKEEFQRSEEVRGQVHDYLFGDPAEMAGAAQDALTQVQHLQNEVLAKHHDFRAKSLADLQALNVDQLAAYKVLLTKQLQADVQYSKDAETAGKALSDARQRALESGLKTQEAGFRAQAATAKQAYEQGLSSLAAFYAERERIVQAQAAAEATAIGQERAAVAGRTASTPQARATQQAQLAELDARLQQAQIASAEQLATLTAERLIAQRDLQQKALAFEAKLAEARGQRGATERAAIAQEAEEYRLTLVKLGDADATRKAQLLRDARDEQLALAELGQRSEAFLAELDRTNQRIANAVQSGTITPEEGRRQTLGHERQQLPQLQDLRTQLQAGLASTTDPRQQLALQAQIDKLDQLVLVLNDTALSYQKLGVAGADAFEGGLETGLTGVLDQTESFGSAWAAAANAARHAIDSVIARLAALYIQQQLTHLLGLGGAIAGGGSAAGAPTANISDGAFTHDSFAGGGLVAGPGTATSDSIPAWLSNHEYVLRAHAVRSLASTMGMGFLHDLNHRGVEAFRRFGLPRGIRQVGHYATGGLVGSALGASGAAGGGFRADIGLEPGLVAKHLESYEGERAVIRIVTKNLRGITRAQPR